MSYRYIPQENNENFVFPNYDLAEYDVDIIHQINSNSVSGVVNSFTATSVSSTAITLNYNLTWYQNGAEIYRRPSTGNVGVWSVHALTSNQTYFKPWRMIGSASISAGSYTGQTSYTPTTTINTITPSQCGVASFTSGTYYFEVRFIGANSIYPVCITLPLTIP